ncbi:hypothetical protein LAG73_12785 [Pseudoxanthomonas japonensis]|nr:hypothetical protein LAG73_12785 [Pseudoxanthomonas japonensis]
MRTKTPPSLKWLVDKRARLKAEIERDKADAQSARRRAESLDGRWMQLRQDLDAIDRALSLHEICLDPESIRPVRAVDSVRLLPWAHMTRAILGCLRRAKGDWRSTTEIVIYVAQINGLELDASSAARVRLLVRKRLQGLHASGRVARRHGAKANLEGYWSLPRGVAG